MTHLAEAFQQDVPPVMPGTDFEDIESGEMNRVLMGSDGPTPTVVKIPRPLDDIDTTCLLRREVAAVNLLDTTHANMPVETPQVLCTDPESRWAAFTSVAGQVLTHEVIRQEFSAVDFRAYGQKLGQFVARVGQVVDIDTFSRTIDGRYGPCPVDREKQLTDRYPHKATVLREQGYPQLAEAFVHLGRDHEMLSQRGALAPTIVGHDDLHPGNGTFVRDHGAWHLSGIFDFGNMKLSTPAREFRFMPQFHPEATRAAINAYKERTGHDTPEHLVNFWFRMQSVMGAIRMIEEGYNFTPTDIKLMQLAYPDFDWEAELL